MTADATSSLFFFGLLPLAAGLSVLALRGAMWSSVTGRFYAGTALGLDALTVYGLLQLTAAGK